MPPTLMDLSGGGGDVGGCMVGQRVFIDHLCYGNIKFDETEQITNKQKTEQYIFNQAFVKISVWHKYN